MGMARIYCVGAVVVAALALVVGCTPETEPKGDDGGVLVIDGDAGDGAGDSAIVSDGGSADAGDAGGDSDAVTPENFGRRLVEAWCERLPSCLPLGSDTFTTMLSQYDSVEDCKADAGRLAASPLFTAADALRANEDGRRGFDETSAKRCIAHARAGRCFVYDDECTRAFPPATNLEEKCWQNEDCVDQMTCVKPRNSCVDGECRPSDDVARACDAAICEEGEFCNRSGECEALRDEGDPCDFTDEWCAEGLRCAPDPDSFEYVCTTPASNGSACDLTMPCEFDSFCNSQNMCVSRRGDGGSCNDDDECLTGYFCNLGLCEKRDIGRPCDDSFGGAECWGDLVCYYDPDDNRDECHEPREAYVPAYAPREGAECERRNDCEVLEGLACNFNDGAATGLCRRMGSFSEGDDCSTDAVCADGLLCLGDVCQPLAPVAVGQPCVELADVCEFGAACNDGTCEELGEELDDCRRDHHCGVGLGCDRDTNSCRQLLADGESCMSDLECMSRFCVEDTCRSTIPDAELCELFYFF